LIGDAEEVDEFLEAVKADEFLEASEAFMVEIYNLLIRSNKIRFESIRAVQTLNLGSDTFKFSGFSSFPLHTGSFYYTNL